MERTPKLSAAKGVTLSLLSMFRHSLCGEPNLICFQLQVYRKFSEIDSDFKYDSRIADIVVVQMAKFVTKTRKDGKSMVVTLPKELVESQNIKENQCVEITVKKCRIDGFGMLKGISPFTVDDKLKGQLEETRN